MKKSPHLRHVLSSALVALGLWSIPSAQAQICTREYAPVCGQIAGQMPQTFPNRCTLDHAKARFIAQGECPHSATSPTQPLLGGDSDAHGCKASAGFVWNAELASCIRPWISSAITLEVAAHRQKCPGQVDARCLMVREVQEGQKKPRWKALHGEIQGYKHTVGHRQLLRVRKDLQENASADAPGLNFLYLRHLR
ncbi:MAG: hypothetical protein RJB14_1655 [Pseudomonadota bacterium]